MKWIDKMLAPGKKKSVRDWMVIAVICGLLLLIVFFPVGKRSEKNENVFLNTVTETGENANSLTDEKRLKELLEKIDKIGSVEVMITYGKESGFYETNQAEIAGIVVICRKECDSESVLLIHEVIQALFPVSAHKIKVVKGISS